MSIEGLQAILDKEEIVATQRAETLVAHPTMVDDAYRRHVRTYVPFGRRSGGGNGQSVAEFEKEVIREVKARGAVRGYITAEYGHGKTSTALYLWQQARDANLLAAVQLTGPRPALFISRRPTAGLLPTVALPAPGPDDVTAVLHNLSELEHYCLQDPATADLWAVIHTTL